MILPSHLRLGPLSGFPDKILHVHGITHISHACYTTAHDTSFDLTIPSHKGPGLAPLSMYLVCVSANTYEYRQNMTAVEGMVPPALGCPHITKTFQGAPALLSADCASIQLCMSLLYQFPFINE